MRQVAELLDSGRVSSEERRAQYHAVLRREGDRLHRLVENLLDNAVKYSPHDRMIDVSVARDNGHVALSVRDRGVGIPADEHAMVFQDFVRGRSAKASGVPGTGIGLAMVRHIVRAHGGEVRFISAVGEGSTFTILLEPAES
ncbi:MAG: ATP-binding protein [Gemmatimonadaceae bacterium]